MKRLNKYWRPKARHVIGIALLMVIAYGSGYFSGSQEIIAAIGSTISLAYLVIKLYNSLFKGREDDK